ncbi:unnamed protein product [Rhodiola kirilowii]
MVERCQLYLHQLFAWIGMKHKTSTPELYLCSLRILSVMFACRETTATTRVPKIMGKSADPDHRLPIHGRKLPTLSPSPICLD